MNADMAWAAGLYEGEGSLGITKNRGYPRLLLGMTDRDVVERFRDVLGFGSIHVVNQADRKTMYRFECGGWVNVAQVKDWFDPYLGERRRARFDEVLSMKPERPVSPDCGLASTAGYRKHRTKGEPACAPCRKANTEYERARRGQSPRYPDGQGYT